MSSNGFKSTNFNINNCNNDNYYNSSIQRNLTYQGASNMLNSDQGFTYGTGIKY